MKFDLARMAKTRRRFVALRPIISTRVQANDLARLYLRILAPLSVAADIAMPAYERELARALQHDSAEDLGASVDGIAGQINRLLLSLAPDLRDFAVRVDDWHKGKWVRAVLAGLEVDISTLIGREMETIGAFLLRNASLIRDINEEARGRIADAVLRGLQQRKAARDVAKEIREATGMARKRAIRVAADQSMKLSAALDAERQRQAGLTVWRWVHSGKLHPRTEHKARDGNLYADDPRERGKLASGQSVAAPPGDLPGELPYCGCVRQAMLIFEGAAL